jgi:hypothetical protein
LEQHGRDIVAEGAAMQLQAQLLGMAAELRKRMVRPVLHHPSFVQ